MKLGCERMNVPFNITGWKPAVIKLGIQLTKWLPKSAKPKTICSKQLKSMKAGHVQFSTTLLIILTMKNILVLIKICATFWATRPTN